MNMVELEFKHLHVGLIMEKEHGSGVPEVFWPVLVQNCIALPFLLTFLPTCFPSSLFPERTLAVFQLRMKVFTL